MSAGTFSSPARRARSWSPPTSSGASRRPRRTSSAPVPGGPPSLWPLTDSRSAPRSSKAIGHVPDRLGRVDVHEHAARRGSARRPRRTGWQGPDLVVAPLHVHERGVGTRRAARDLVRIDAAEAVDADDGHRSARRGGERGRSTRAPPSARPRPRTTWAGPLGLAHRAPGGGGDRLGGAAGEHDLAGRAPTEAATCSRACSSADPRRHALGVDAARDRPAPAPRSPRRRARPPSRRAPRAAAATSTRGRGSAGPSRQPERAEDQAVDGGDADLVAHRDRRRQLGRGVAVERAEHALDHAAVDRADHRVARWRRRRTGSAR